MHTEWSWVWWGKVKNEAGKNKRNKKKMAFFFLGLNKLPWFQRQWWGFPSHQSRLHNFHLVPSVQQSAGSSTQAEWTVCDGLQEDQSKKQDSNHLLMETILLLFLKIYIENRKCNETDLWSRWGTPLHSCCSRAPLPSWAHLCWMAGCHSSWQPGSRR